MISRSGQRMNSLGLTENINPSETFDVHENHVNNESYSGINVNSDFQDHSEKFQPGKTERRKKARGFTKYSIRPLKIGDIARAMKIAADNFSGEVGLVARSYLWHFARKAGFPHITPMWSKWEVHIEDAGETVTLDLLSSFVHGRDVAWIDLASQPEAAVDLAMAAMRRWPRFHRLLVVRIERVHAPQFLAAGFRIAGHIPDGHGEHIYLYAERKRLIDPLQPAMRVRFSGRRSVSSDCEFSVVECNGSIIGLTGIYETEFWRGVTWGAWGAIDPARARRDAVFETLRLTENRAKQNGARWFCLETSDCEKYRHARRIYEIYGLRPLLTIPNFYLNDDGKAEKFIVYGKPTSDDIVRTPTIVSERA